MTSAKKLYPSIPPGTGIHIYGPDLKKSVIWKGYLFKPGDIVFRLGEDELIADTPL